MNPPDFRADARLGLLALYAMDMYTGAGSAVIEPPADPRLAPDWRLCGYLTGTDALFRAHAAIELGGERVCYGFVAESATMPGVFVAVVRGTNGILEWAEDAEFLQHPHPLGGQVEDGFFAIHQTMEFRVPGGPDAPAAAAIAALIGTGSVTVIGHSLGGALATFLAFDLGSMAHLVGRVSARLFASPQPGDAEFARLFATRVPDHVAYAYELDVVPHVPFGFGYSSLPNLLRISPATAQSRIRFSLDCHHHIVCYCSMLDYTLLNWSAVPVCDRSLTTCIRGPVGPAA